jgi:UDP-glucuronate decarboxylase
MIDGIIHEDIAKIESAVKGSVFEGKKILVTGGAGFIGSWLCDVLIGFSAEVIAVDDLSTGRLRNIDHLTENSKFKFVQCDACTFHSKDKLDFILHMAAHASPEEYQTHPIETLQASSFGSANMAELARKNDAAVLFASTSEVYGDAEIVPTPESYWGKVNPIGPRSCYDEGKRFAETLFMAYYKQYGLSVRIPRIFNSYGPRLREDGVYGRAMSRFTMQALMNNPITVYGDGTQTRSFCYITDTVTSLMLLTASDKAKGEVVNVGNSQEISILELAEKIKELTRCSSSLSFHPLPKDDPKRRCPDTTKLEKLVKWKPKINLGKGLTRTINWFLSKEKYELNRSTR